MKDSNIKLSVIIPYYNADKWVGKILDSLLDQDVSYDTYEIIVVDDGSTQGIDTLKHYIDKYPNIRYFRQNNAGQSVARNNGVNLARGEWLYFCDSDDYIQPQVFGFLIKTAEELNLDMLVCDWCVVQPDAGIRAQKKPFPVSRVKTGREYLASFAPSPMSIGFGVWRFFIKKSILTDNNIRFESISFAEDRIFQLDALLVVGRVAHVGVNLYYYVQHQASITHRPKRENYTVVATWLWHYIEKLSGIITDNPMSLTPNAITVLDGWRDMAVFSLLINCFRYCPVSVTKHYLQMLKSQKGAYPVRIRAPRRTTRTARWLMGHEKFWILLCRVFHILPFKVRVSL